MLKIKKIVLHNFGPYYGTHEIVIPQEDGVTIVWGSNGFGKTTIMNSFSYVMWGNIYNQKKQRVSPHKYVNSNVLDSVGDRNMSVELCISYDGVDYSLYRGLNRRSGDGTSIQDYEHVFSVKNNNNVLSSKEREDLLNRAFPERISRFYLFDGELLAEYEDLLDEEDETGKKIKSAIEDILGVPILENARDNLGVIESSLNKELSTVGKKNERTKEISKSLEANEEKKEHLLQSRKDLETDIQTYELQKQEVEEQMKNSQTFRSLMSKRDEIAEDVSNLEDKIKNILQDDVSRIMKDAWKSMLSPVISELNEQLRNKVVELQQKHDKSKVAKGVYEFIAKSLEKSPCHCPICENEISKETISKIYAKCTQDAANYLSSEEQSLLDETNRNISYLKSLSIVSKKDEAKTVFKTLESYKDELELKRVKLDDATHSLMKISASYDEEEIKELPHKLVTCVKIIEERKRSLSEISIDLQSCDRAIEICKNQIMRMMSNNDEIELLAKRVEFVSKLHNALKDCISTFRDRLKENVEKDATAIFKSISHNTEYDHLSINENYGLEIKFRDNTSVSNRSAGYAQVVAISLIGALQKNAPIGGPIFMDSTFQRIDSIHKQNTIAFLPKFGRQVIVLAYHDEMGDENTLRHTLGTKLLSEYELKQEEGSTKTTINLK